MAVLSARRVDPFNLLVDYGIWAALGIAIIAAAASTPRFLSAANIHDLMSSMAVLGIVSVGQTVVVLSGGIDLSVGMLMGLVTVLTNGIMNGDPALAWPMIALGVAIGIAVGLVNGGLLVLTRIDPLILTFGMLSILTGAIFVYTDQTVGSAPDNFRQIAEGALGPFPILFLIMLAVALVAWVVLTRTPFGRYVYAIGGSEEHARRAGIAIGRMKLSIYTISGLCAGIAGVGLAAPARLRLHSRRTGVRARFDRRCGSRRHLPRRRSRRRGRNYRQRAASGHPRQRARPGGSESLRSTGGEGLGSGGRGGAVHAGTTGMSLSFNIGRSWRRGNLRGAGPARHLGRRCALLVAVASVLSPYFFSINNFLNILNQSSVVGITAVGVTLVMITGAVDLSVGSVH